MNKVKKYPAYKDSGIEWIGEIPEHWEVRKAKWLFKKENRLTRKADEVITCFRDGEVTLRKNRRVGGFTNSLKEIGYQGIREGDLVIHAMDAFAGAIGVSDSDGKGTPVYSVCTPIIESINNFFYAYLLRYMSSKKYIEALAKGIRERSTDFRFTEFAKLTLPLPPLSEQKKIASFLDKKTGEIDKAIELKQKENELLKERRQVAINQAVTRGLHPTVTYKDSGIEWIGEIPEHWEVRKLKYITSIYNGNSLNDKEKVKYESYNLDDIAYLSSKDINSETLYASYNNGLRIPVMELSNFKVAPQYATLLCIEGGSAGKKITYLQESVCFVNKLACFKHYNNTHPKYIYFSLQSGVFKSQFNLLMTGLIGGVSLSNLKNCNIPLPPLSEQKEIAEYLEELDGKTNRLLDLNNQAIAKLKEYKQVVIDQAVRGQICLV